MDASIETQNIEREAYRSLRRILPRVEGVLDVEIKNDPERWREFPSRLHKKFVALFTLLVEIYSDQYDFFFHLEDLLISMARSWLARPADLRDLDRAREQNPLWFQSNQMLGGVCYVDLFAGNLEGVRSKIPYFKELGLTYLHLMPLFKVPAGENDGGYAVSSYREVHPPLGTMEQLASLAGDFRAAGISLVVDLVFNHTSDEHIWAERAKAGDEEYVDFYYIFPSREMPDAYERSLREIFPDEHPGAFTFFPNLFSTGGWVWNSLATRKVRLLSQALATRFAIHPDTAWVNYVRVHDDIGWTFSDEDAIELGLNAYNHRRFLNEFYRGRFEGSFARGLPFQENPKTGDCRISGTGASLAGLEKALKEEGLAEVDLAIRRILLIHGVILTAGGIPLIYLGDEIGTLNDYSYRDDPDHERDSRWVHRPPADWEKYAKRNDLNAIEGRVYQGLQRLIKLRKENEVFSGGKLEVIPTENEHVLGFMRMQAGKRAIILANFSEHPQSIPGRVLDQYSIRSKKVLHGISDVASQGNLTVSPLDFLVFGST